MKILVYGGTGSQGSAVVRKALERGHETYILTRTADKAAAFVGAGGHVASGDLNDFESLRAASKGMDAVAFMIPFSIAEPQNSLQYAQQAIDAAKEANVKLLVYNTSGPVIAERTNNPSFDLRLDVIAYLEKSGVPYIVLQPTVYMENLLGPWTLSGIAQNNTLAYPVAETEHMGWLASADLGSLTIAALEHSELAPAKFVISGVENVTGPELAARFSEALGRDIRYQVLTPTEFGAMIEAAFGMGMGAGAEEAYQWQAQHADQIQVWTDMQPVLEKLPVQMTSITEWVRGFAPIFNAQMPQQA